MKPLAESETHTQPHCPRCGYNLRGVMLTWEESCPLTGMCSECGFEFDWQDVFSPDVYGPRWCVEYAPRKRNIVPACFKTYLRSQWPWHFWSRLRLEQQIKPGRLFIYLCCLIPCLYVMCVSYLAVIVWQRDGDSGVPLNYQAKDALITCLLPTSSNAVVGQRWGRPTTPSDILWEYRREFERYFGTNQIDLLLFQDQESQCIVLFLLSVCVVPLCPLCSVVLTVTFRRAKVRYVHLVRIAVYSAPIILFSVFSVLETLRAEVGWYYYETLWSAVITTWIPPVWLVLWWGCAARYYLKIRHAWWTGLVIVGMAYLAVLLILTLIAGCAYWF